MMNEGKYSYDEVVNMVNKIRERINDSTVSEELKEFMNRMVVADYKERADIYELIDMKWLNGKKEMMRSLNEINEEEGQKMFIELQKSEYYEKKDTKKKKKFKYNRKQRSDIIHFVIFFFVNRKDDTYPYYLIIINNINYTINEVSLFYYLTKYFIIISNQ